MDMTTQLISEVEKREHFWNPTTASYKNRDLRDIGWIEICEKLNLDQNQYIKEVKNKWSSLRNSLRVRIWSTYLFNVMTNNLGFSFIF